MSEKLSLLERLIGATKKKTETNLTALETQIKQQLKGLVYDDELVEELAPVFLKLHGQEGFNQVMELLITKEKQIETISGGDWFKQESNSEDKKTTTEDESVNLVDQILKSQYSEK